MAGREVLLLFRYCSDAEKGLEMLAPVGARDMFGCRSSLSFGLLDWDEYCWGRLLILVQQIKRMLEVFTVPPHSRRIPGGMDANSMWIPSIPYGICLAESPAI